MRLLVTGQSGQLAMSLAERATRHPDIELVALGRPALDFADLDAIAPAVERTGPDIVVNAAAYTAVEKAEDESDAARRINAEAAGEVARAAHNAGAPVIQISTDYVFDGAKGAPYVETDATAPLNVYGRTKLEGEHAVAAANPRYYVFRTAWVYSPFGANFVKTMLRLATERDEVAVVADQYGNPTAALDLADAILAAARKIGAPGAGPPPGIYHVAGTGDATWHDFATEIFAANHDLTGTTTQARPIGHAGFPTRALRPADSRLDCGLFSDAFGHKLPDWRTSVRDCVRRLVAAGA